MVIESVRTQEPFVQGQRTNSKFLIETFQTRPAIEEQTAFRRQRTTSFPTRSDELSARSTDSS